jgi:hypothetical protein
VTTTGVVHHRQLTLGSAREHAALGRAHEPKPVTKAVRTIVMAVAAAAIAFVGPWRLAEQTTKHSCFDHGAVTQTGQQLLPVCSQ